MTFEEFILEARAMGASDIHLTVGAPTVVRINGELCNSVALTGNLVVIQNDKVANQIGFGADPRLAKTPPLYDFQASDFTLVRAGMYDSAVTNEQAAAIYEYAVANLSK